MSPHRPLGRANIIGIVRFDHGLDTVESALCEIVRRELPATWLLQYDALATGPYIDFLKTHAPANHRIGLWFEVNQRLCRDAGVGFRGEIPDPTDTLDTFNWDHHCHARLGAGYYHDERFRLTDTLMQKAFAVFGFFPRAVAGSYMCSENLDYLSMRYQISISAIRSDRWIPDGLSIWGPPLHGFYFPSKAHTAMAAPTQEMQINVPVVRLGSGRSIAHPPIFRNSGKDYSYSRETIFINERADPEWIHSYFNAILDPSTQPFGYLCIGFENRENWQTLRKHFCHQLDELVHRQNQGQLQVETMDQTGDFIHSHYTQTPTGVIDLKSPLPGETHRAFLYHCPNFRSKVRYNDRCLEICDYYRYDNCQMEPYYQQPVCTWNAWIMAAPIIDSVLFGSRWYLEFQTPDGVTHCERNLRIFDVEVSEQEDDEAMILSYRNEHNVHSRLIFTHDGICAQRVSNEPVIFYEVLEIDPQGKFDPFQGTLRNQIVFAWNNYDYRAEVREGLVTYEPEQNRILLRPGYRARESTTTFYAFPCIMPNPPIHRMSLSHGL